MFFSKKSMTQKVSQMLDAIQAQSMLGKLLLPAMTIFLIISAIIFFSGGVGLVSLTLICAAMLAFYLAINIGANDVANNMGPAV